MVLLTDKKLFYVSWLVVEELGLNQDLTRLVAVCYCGTELGRFVLCFGKQPMKRGQYGHFDEWSHSDL